MRTITLFLLAVLWLSACKTKTEYIDLELSGTINGHISEVYGSEPNKDGIKVELVGTTISTLTDTAGRFSLQNVPAGTYDLRFTRDKLGTNEVQDVGVTGGDVPVVITKDIKMIEAPTHNILTFTPELSGSDIVINYSTDSEIQFIQVDIESEPNQPPFSEELISTYGLSESGQIITKSFLDHMGAKGVVYLRAYPMGFKSVGYYFSRETGGFVFPHVASDRGTAEIKIVLLSK